MNDNLAALCQVCHLRLDAKQHADNAAETRRAREHDPLPGQTGLFSLPPTPLPAPTPTSPSESLSDQGEVQVAGAGVGGGA